MEHSWGYFIGFIVGVALSIALIWLLFRLLGRKGKLHFKQDYDERQQLAQGKAAKLALYVGMGWLIVDGLVSSMIYNWADVFTHLFAACLAMVAVYALDCIRRDAYIGLKDSSRRWTGLLLGLGLLNLGIGVMNYRHGQLLVLDGLLTSNSISFMCCILLLLVAAAMAVYSYRLRSQARAEDDLVADEFDDESEV